MPSTNRTRITLTAAICLVVAGAAAGVIGYASHDASGAICDPTERSLDATWVVDNVIPSDNPDVIWKYQFEGTDFFGEATVDGLLFQEIGKDGVLYDRRGDTWSTEDAPYSEHDGFCGPTEDENAARSPSVDPVYTKGDARYRLAGTEILDGETIRRFERLLDLGERSTRDDPDVVEVISYIDETLYVNETGHVVRVDVVLTVHSDGAVIQETNYEMRFSGYGETNVITAPVLPTHTPPTSN